MDHPRIEMPLQRRIEIAVSRIQAHAPKDGSPVYVAFSGGKDSLALKLLVQMSGVAADYHYNVTPDPPELIAYIRQHHPEVQFHYPELSMYRLIKREKMLATRLIRFCCDHLKKEGTWERGRMILTGVRWAESQSRAARAVMVRPCIQRDSIIVNPLIDWSDADVWDLIRKANAPHCCLYDEGFTRLGCVSCPMGGPAQMARGFERWPGFLRMYYRAAEKILPELMDRRKKNGKPQKFTTPGEMILWWLGDKTKDHRHRNTVEWLMIEGGLQ